MAEVRNSYKISVDKSEGKRLLLRLSMFLGAR